MIKEKQSKEVVDKLLEDAVVKPLFEATVDESGIVFKIESIRSLVLLKKDLRLLKIDLHKYIAQIILADKKIAFITAGRLYSAEDGLIPPWLVRKFLLSINVLGFPDRRIGFGATSASSAAAAATMEAPAAPVGQIAVRGMPPRQQQAERNAGLPRPVLVARLAQAPVIIHRLEERVEVPDIIQELMRRGDIPMDNAPPRPVAVAVHANPPQPLNAVQQPMPLGPILPAAPANAAGAELMHDH
jgi:hypothetical protein